MMKTLIYSKIVCLIVSKGSKMKKFVTNLALILFAIASVQSHADDYMVRGLVGGFSYHGDRTKNHNEENWGAGVQVGDYILYTYYNSNYSQTVVLAKDFMYSTPINGLSLGGMFGIATGYTDGGEANYAGMLRARYEFDNGVFVDLNHLPNFKDVQGVVTEIHFGYNFGSYSLPNYSMSGLDGFSFEYLYGLGGGKLSVGYDLNNYLTLRVSATNAKIDWVDNWYHNDTLPTTMHQNERFHLQTTGIELDYKPLKGWLSLYAGLVHNNSDYNTDYSVWIDEEYAGYDVDTQINIGGKPAIVHHGDKLYGSAEWDKLAITFGLRYSYDVGDKDGWLLTADLGGTHFLEAYGSTKYESQFATEGERALVEELASQWKDGDTVKERYSNRALPTLRVGLSYKF